MVIQCLFPKVKNRLDLGIQIQKHPSVFLFLLATPCSHMQSCFPNQGLNPCPLHWKCVLTTGQPGRFPSVLLHPSSAELWP